MSLSQEQFEQIKREIALPNHRTMAQIAASYGVTKNALIGKLHRAKLAVGTPRSVVRDHLLANLAVIRKRAFDGASKKAVAIELRCDPKTICRFARAHGIQFRPRDRQLRAHCGFNRYIGKPQVLTAADRAEMNRLVAEAVAAGKVTRCPPGRAVGSITFHPIERAA